MAMAATSEDWKGPGSTPRPASWASTAAVITSPPMPPASSGAVTPSQPISTISCQTSSSITAGRLSSPSRERSVGQRSRRKSRAISWRASCSSLRLKSNS